MNRRVAHPRRYDNLHRIARLDPAVDSDEIIQLVAYHEFPWEYVQGTSIAFMRDYGVPSISDLLDRTGRFEHDGQKRYADRASAEPSLLVLVPSDGLDLGGEEADHELAGGLNALVFWDGKKYRWEPTEFSSDFDQLQTLNPDATAK